ncbi:hypothetical protein GCM10010448_21580 [Streptomyces glomeratus]|uniref:Uncharacterized protein n=1 Tax=Streptomyces glomeratus TaxID=284452 RepID=A0ABP6LCV6_9ACTN
MTKHTTKATPSSRPIEVAVRASCSLPLNTGGKKRDLMPPITVAARPPRNARTPYGSRTSASGKASGPGWTRRGGPELLGGDENTVAGEPAGQVPQMWGK